MSDRKRKGLIGTSVKRLEDPRFLTGRGQYLDDVNVPGQLHAAFLRSPHAHARIKRIDVSKALALPGVLDVVTGQDLIDAGHSHMRLMWQLAPELLEIKFHAMAVDRVRYVGHTVACVAAVDRFIAEDALDLIEVEYERLPVVVNVDEARAGTVALYDYRPSNIAGTVSYKKGDVAAAFAKSDVVLKHRFEIGRAFACPLETRGCIATWDPLTKELDMWNSTQSAHYLRDLLGEILNLKPSQIRVRTPDLGGGFGAKCDTYTEDVVIAELSRRTNRPVKWVEDRRESFVATVHARNITIDAELSATHDGKITGMKATVMGDIGGQLSAVGMGPVWLCTATLMGPYKIPNMELTGLGILTNKAPYGSYRGWGGPQANFVHERFIELLARELKMDRTELRRKNLIQPDEMPYNTGILMTYDSGNFPDTLDLCVNALKEKGWLAKQIEAKAEGRSIGIGFSFHSETTNFGPSRACNEAGLTHPGFDESFVRMDSTGRVIVATGITPMGQGIKTALAQVAAETLGVPLGHINVVHGDTSTTPFTGYSTGGSRGGSLGGAAVIKAATQVKEKVLKIAAHMLEASPEDLEIAEGVIAVKGAPNRSVTVEDVGYAANRGMLKLPVDIDPILDGRAVFDPPNFACTYGCSAAVVEVDRETGFVKVLDYIMAHDCGPMINPTIVDGQLHGGLTQSIGSALYEELVYDDQGQILTTTFMDYLIPTASEVPTYTLLHLDPAVPAPGVPGGFKGVGESGTMSPYAALANAVDDALSDMSVTITSMPITPNRLRNVIRAAEQSR